ncbi:ion transporter [Photobacterium damselae]|uniref:ion transporter n=1 Tax=Photobacterium damselae TaxID=38293 RepID=UPI0010FD5C8F|nr:ion transporter [Photobacterium damselae]TLS76163.1 ion transporter [Photobacterium damselae subsp. damselae]TLS86437.1 ion transporter [Photobacterium damselae subsp. damselae]
MYRPKVPEQITSFQLAVLMLSLFVVISLTVELIFKLPPEILKILIYVDTFICVIFFIDFVQQYRAAPSKLEYMKWGWLDLISCIPLMEMNQFARLIRVFRLIRAIKSISMISHAINENKASTSLHFMVVTSLMMMVFGSIYILYLEKDMPGANIHTAGDSFWWTFVTITTVGYGDFFPVTLEGRIVAIVLITTGVGMFGSFTAVLASWIMDTSNERKMEVQILEEVHELKAEVRELKSILKKQTERNE